MRIFYTHRFTIGRLCQIGVGIVFLVAGMAKLIDPAQFYWHTLWQIFLISPKRPFGMVGIGPTGQSFIWETAAHGVTLFLIPFELFLSVALLINYRPKLTLPATGAFLLSLIGITTYAWFRGMRGDCGCFGGLIERTPGETIIEDLVLLAMMGLAWWGRSPQAQMYQPTWQKRLILWTGVGVFVLNSLLLFTAKPYWHGSDLRVGGTFPSIRAEGKMIDLRQGEHLLIFFNTGCPISQVVVPRLNALAVQDDLPPLIGLSANAAEQRAMFLQQFSLHYPIQHLSIPEMHRLLWTHTVPYLVYLNEGSIQRAWEGSDLLESSAMRVIVQSVSKRVSP